MAKWCDQGENRVLEILFAATAVDATLYLGIYEDGTEPAESDTLSDITENNDSGYARIAITRNTEWTVTNDAAVGDQQTFTATGDWTAITGWFLCTSASGTGGALLCVEDFTNGPYTLYSGDSIKVTPTITCA